MSKDVIPNLTEMSVPDIVKKYPSTQAVFEHFSLHTSYKALAYENLSATTLVNQIDLDTLVCELKKVL